MKRIYSILLILFFTMIGGVSAWFFTNETVEKKSYETTLFMTVFSSDENSSVEEKETASHFFSEAILGWTISPAFTSQLGFDVQGRKQERGNIIFQYSSLSLSESEKQEKLFQNLLQEKLTAYNNLAKTRYGFLLENPQTEEKIPKKSFWTLGGIMAGFFLGLFLIEACKLWQRRRKESL